MRARIIAIICLSAIIFSCNNQSKKSSEAKTDKTAKENGVKKNVPMLTQEEAETIISKYFSEKNQQKGYIHYKALFLDIDSIIHSENEQSAGIISTISWRETKNQADTTSIPFAITDSFRLNYTSYSWKSDK